MADGAKHYQGIYSDKFVHKKVQCEQGRYITIGDPYKDPGNELPVRWKAKQLRTPHHPENAGGGFFGLMGKPFIYMPDRYAAQLSYTKSQPFASRRLGFGTHDAFKRDEFTHRIRTEQYRDLLKREKRLLRPITQSEIEAARRRAILAEEAAAIKRAEVGLAPPNYLYDIGKSRETPFDARLARDAFYNPLHARQREPRYGPYRTSSADIGHGAWKAPPVEHHAKAHATRTFYTHGHFQIGDI